MLVGILTYHVLAGKMTMADIAAKVDEMGGKFTAKTVNGAELTFKRSGAKHLTVTDAKGGTANITIADVIQSNGVIHVINKVLLPG